MADDHQNEFVIPKLCIRRIPIPQPPISAKKQKPNPTTTTTEPEIKTEVGETSKDRQESSTNAGGGSGGLKVILRVPNKTEQSSTNADAIEDDSRSSERDSEASKDDQDGETIKLSAFLRTRADGGGADDSSLPDAVDSTPAGPSTGDDEEGDDGAGGSSKKPRRPRKKRFRLSVPTPKTAKAKLIKTESSENADRDSSTPHRPKRSKKKDDGGTIEDGSSDEATMPPTETAIVEPVVKFPMPSPEEMASYTPMQVLLDYLLRGFLKKDPEYYFAFPVTEEIAPNYSSIISKPMDFSTVRKKIVENEYKNLRQFKEDIELICSNAMTYNQKNTIYHMAARKLQNVAEYFFSKEKLNVARRVVPQFSKLTREEICVNEAELSKKAEARKAKLGHYSCIVDDMSPEEVVEQATSAAEAVRKQLKLQRPNIQVTFAGTKTTTLKTVLPEHVAEKSDNIGAEDKSNRPVTLGDLVPKLKEGNPGLLIPTDNKDLVVPITYLDHGAFSSFAPFYDSTWATLNKEESDLLLATFGGDEHCVRYVDSLRTFAQATTERMKSTVESIVDEIVHGKPPTPEEEDSEELSASDVAYSALNSLIDDEPYSFVEDSSIASDQVQQSTPDSSQSVLDQNATLLRDLFVMQNQRLSTQPTFVLTHAPGPSEMEIDTAGKLVYNIQQLASQTTPGELASTEAVREVIQGPPEINHAGETDDYDMDVLREFLVVEND